jgi:hypothetical protein
MRVLFVCPRELARNPIDHVNPWIEDYRRGKPVNRTNSVDLSHQFMRYDSSARLPPIVLFVTTVNSRFRYLP